MDVLLVEDSPTQRMALRVILRQAGFDVREAEDGEDALAKAREVAPDAIVSDILMPGIDGFQLCREIRADRALTHLPVVLLSGKFNESTDLDLAIDAGADACLDKDGVKSQLPEAIRKAALQRANHSNRAEPRPVASTDDQFQEKYANRMRGQLVQQADELDRLQKVLPEAIRAKTDFLAMISHELRTPMTSILGFAETLESHWESFADADRRTYVQVMGRQTRRLAAMIDELLAFSGIDSGSLPVSVSDIDLLPALQQGLDMGETQGVLEISADPSLRVRADGTRIAQAVFHYVKNAHKYGGGATAIEARRVGAAVEVIVSDEGDGVEPELIPRLFERFAKGESPEVRTKPGVGLGLAMVKTMIEAQHGTVWFEPNEPQGSKFGFKLPAAETATVAASDSAIEAAP